ncbi:MAG: ribosome maturation factor RimM [Leptospirales bacterium]
MSEPLLVGRVGRSFGVRGYGRVQLLSDNPARFLGDIGETFLLRASSRFLKGAPSKSRSLVLEDARDQSGVLLVKWAGIDSPEALREIAGWEILWEGEDDWVPEESDAERLDDLVGFAVLDVETGQRVGTVAGYYDRSGQDLLSIQTQGGQEVLCPFVQPLVPEIDREKGEVTVLWSIVGTSG